MAAGVVAVMLVYCIGRLHDFHIGSSLGLPKMFQPLPLSEHIAALNINSIENNGAF